MNLQGLFMFNKSFHIISISIIFAFLAEEATSADPNFDACVPENCGNDLDISYPFWIANQQESHCGHPNFEVTCNGKHPVIRISGDDYIIKDVFYPNQSFLLAAAAAAYDSSNTCPIPLHNFSVEGTPFEYYSGDGRYPNLFFFYNCSSFPFHRTNAFSSSPSSPIEYYSVACAGNAAAGAYSFAVFDKESLKRENFSTESCNASVNAPVGGDEDDIGKLLETNFTDVLRKGFVLQWSEGNCSDCKKSGGRCGSANEEFICFCADQPHSKICPNNGNLNVPRKVAIGFGAAGITLIVMVVIFFFYLRQHNKRYISPSWNSRNISFPSSMTGLEKAGTFNGVQIFSYIELEKATHYFDPKNELGDGGYGTVYRGKLKDGRVVAVKRLFEHNYKRVEQFLNEVEILTRLRHQNLVSLYGCTSRRCRELLLVYEYIPNGTVADHLHGDRARPGSLSWSTRMSIASETASALAYLHASDVIHRDVKTNNLLLDNNFCVKVADFGLSRLFPTDATHVSTAPQGTPGYVDPEYHECYQLTNKSDVYSFGVVLIELISSKPAVDITRHRHEINLSNMAISKIQNRALHELVDPCIGFESDYKVREMVADVAELAFQCLQNESELRPSMEEVLEVLKRIQSGDCDMKNAEEVDIPANELCR